MPYWDGVPHYDLVMNACIHASMNWVIISSGNALVPLIARFMGPTWGPSGADRTQVGPMLVPWTLLSGTYSVPNHFLNPCLLLVKLNTFNYTSVNFDKNTKNFSSKKMHLKMLPGNGGPFCCGIIWQFDLNITNQCIWKEKLWFLTYANTPAQGFFILIFTYWTPVYN